MATILPFPLGRRRQLVTRCAARMLELSEFAAGEHLARQVTVQREAMKRRGISAALIERQAKSFEASVRAELWRALLQPEGAA